MSLEKIMSTKLQAFPIKRFSAAGSPREPPRPASPGPAGPARRRRPMLRHPASRHRHRHVAVPGRETARVGRQQHLDRRCRSDVLGRLDDRQRPGNRVRPHVALRPVRRHDHRHVAVIPAGRDYQRAEEGGLTCSPPLPFWERGPGGEAVPPHPPAPSPKMGEGEENLAEVSHVPRHPFQRQAPPRRCDQ